MNTERWLVSYADFTTLLFAFFVVLFASSRVDSDKMALMAAAFDSYVTGGAQASRGRKQADRSDKGAIQDPDTARAGVPGLSMAELQPTQERLAQVLSAELSTGKLELSLQPRGLVLSLKESAFFAPGEDTVSPQAIPVLAKLAEALRQVPGQVRLEGHTDNTPIRSRRFPSNWHLSIARSTAVLKLVTREFQFPPERLAVAGYGEHQPLDSNQSERGRTRNRRVDVVILTQAAAAMAPL